MDGGHVRSARIARAAGVVSLLLLALCVLAFSTHGSPHNLFLLSFAGGLIALHEWHRARPGGRDVRAAARPGLLGLVPIATAAIGALS